MSHFEIFPVWKQYFEKQTTLQSFKSMERKMESATKPIILPHCHLYARFFPDDFKGKIVHITRDQSKGLHQRVYT